MEHPDRHLMPLGGHADAVYLQGWSDLWSDVTINCAECGVMLSSITKADIVITAGERLRVDLLVHADPTALIQQAGAPVALALPSPRTVTVRCILQTLPPQGTAPCPAASRDAHKSCVLCRGRGHLEAIH